ncbi:hypothetical protein Arad_7445 [Rhizobium rhizogenes K84]|uniref:Uncharacterized protein n=1 Tax=Rhizobium rhizogenes (strain K84 / ATCC BAA-868) TaxID=311403 RepID=B9JN13_RHIR8|nr:hypothetical protein Arad_7445 [Rhizobium rhizogenes K84]
MRQRPVICVKNIDETAQLYENQSCLAPAEDADLRQPRPCPIPTRKHCRGTG